MHSVSLLVSCQDCIVEDSVKLTEESEKDDSSLVFTLVSPQFNYYDVVDGFESRTSAPHNSKKTYSTMTKWSAIGNHGNG